MSRRARHVLAIGVGLGLALLVVAGVLAASATPADKIVAGEEVIVDAGTVVDHDLYVFAARTRIDGTINGDLVVAGATVTINGAISGDLLTAGSQVTLGPAAKVGGDVRATAADLAIKGSVAEDVAAFATSIEVAPEGRVGGDMLFNASEVVVSGAVGGGVHGTAPSYRRDGTVAGAEDVQQSPGADQPAPNRAAGLALDALRQYVVVVLFGLFLLRFAPRLYPAIAARVRSQPLQSAGLGVLVFFGYVAILLTLVVLMVLIGLAFGQLDFAGFVALDIVGTVLAAFSLTFGLVVFSAFIADAIVGLALGRLVSLGESSRWQAAIRLAIGSALVVITTSFPEVGGLVKLLVILVALGAAGSVWWESRRRTVVGPASVPGPVGPSW